MSRLEAGIRIVTPLAFCLALIAAAVVRPDTVDAQVPRRGPTIELAFENDIFVGALGRPRSDSEYTNGVWVALDVNTAPVWGKLFPEVPICRANESSSDRCLHTRFEIGQKMFTPDITLDPPPPDERPYAGWLYGAMAGRASTDRSSRGLRLEVGLTGPPSLAEEAQRFIHWTTGYPIPLGWDEQLAFEPGVHLLYDEQLRLPLISRGNQSIMEGMLTGAASIGNVRTGVLGAVGLRIGNELKNPWVYMENERAWRVEGTVRLQREWLARDLFLDGNTLGDGPSIERIPTTDLWVLGGAVGQGRVRLNFDFVIQERLYRTQPKPHRWGSLRVSFVP